MIQEYSRHYCDSSPVNDHQLDLDIHDDPLHSTKDFVVEPETLMSYSICFSDTCNIRDLIVGIFIPSSISLPTLTFTCSMIFHPRDLVICCNIGWNLIVGPEYHSVMRMNKSRSWYIRLKLFHWKLKRHLFSHPATVWRLMQSKLPLKVVIKYDLTV
jgi:hypothetical protein